MEKKKSEHLQKEICDIGSDEERLNTQWKVLRHKELDNSLLMERAITLDDSSSI